MKYKPLFKPVVLLGCLAVTTVMTGVSMLRFSAFARPGLQPGRYCYQLLKGDFKANVRVHVDAKGHLSGDTQATVQNPKMSYYTSYRQKFTGSLQEQPGKLALAQLNLTTWIEYDMQTQQETWMLSPLVLKLKNGKTLAATHCATVNKVFQNSSGLEAADLLDSATAIHTQTLRFQPGDRAALVQNSVIRGERDVYLLNARGGQRLTLTLASQESNAVFDLVSPSGLILTPAVTRYQRLLPETGNYQVIVSGTRGNASYRLSVDIAPD